MIALSVIGRLTRFIKPHFVLVALTAMALCNCIGCASAQIDKAAGQCDADSVKSMLQSKPELAASKDNSGHTPLHYAAYRGCVKVAEVLLANHADVNAQDDDGWTALHYAAYYGHMEMAQLLLANHADVNAKDKSGLTPLQAAAINGFPAMADKLIGHDADLTAKDSSGLSALHWSESSRYRDVEDLLRRHGANDAD